MGAAGGLATERARPSWPASSVRLATSTVKLGGGTAMATARVSSSSVSSESPWRGRERGEQAGQRYALYIELESKALGWIETRFEAGKSLGRERVLASGGWGTAGQGSPAAPPRRPRPYTQEGPRRGAFIIRRAC